MASIRFGRGPSGLGASSCRRPCVNALAHCGTPSTVRLRASRTSLVRELGLASAMLVSFLCSKQVSKVVERLRLRVRPALFNVNRRADAFNGKPRQVLQRFYPTSRDGLVVNPPCRRDPCGLKRRKGCCLVLMYYRGHCATIPVDPCTDQWDRELPGANGLNRKTTGTSEPYRVDKDQHLERIDAKFRDEFNRPRSVAADGTSQREGVLSRGRLRAGPWISVVWCRARGRGGVAAYRHASVHHVVWREPADLRRSLRARIERN